MRTCIASRRSLLAVVAILYLGALCARDSHDLRSALNDYEQTKHGRYADIYGLRNYGVSVNREYVRLATLVSNDYKNVFANLDKIATNDAERLLVLGAGWQFGEAFYLDCLDELVDLGMKQVVTLKEIRWYWHLSYKAQLINCLRVRYKEPRITNIIHKLMRLEPNRKAYYEQILSGESYTNYLHEMEARLWD